MYIDSRLEFERGAAAFTANANSTDVVDLQSDRDIGPGQPLYWVVQVVACDGTSGDETYAMNLNTDDNSGFSSATTLINFAIPRGTPAGTRYFFTVPNTNERYLCTRATMTGTTPSLTYRSWLTTEEPASWQSYPDAI